MKMPILVLMLMPLMLMLMLMSHCNCNNQVIVKRKLFNKLTRSKNRKLYA